MLRKRWPETPLASIGRGRTSSTSNADRVHKLITEDIPNRVAADKAYQNAKQNSDTQNARIEHDKALARVMTAVLKDDTALFKQFMDNESFRRWLTDTMLAGQWRAHSCDRSCTGPEAARTRV